MDSKTAPVRVGVIGAGFVAQLAHLDCLLRAEGCELVGLAELRPELRRQVAEKYRLPIKLETHHELLARNDIDAVVVVTRRNATGPIVLDALKAGKHVLSEKPMAHSAAQAEALVQAAQDVGAVYRIGFMKRHDFYVLTARDWLEKKTRTGKHPIKLVRGYSHAGNDGRHTEGLLMTDEPRPNGIELWRAGPDWLSEDFLSEYDFFLNIHNHIVNLAHFLTGRSMTVRHFDYFADAVSTAAVDFGGIPGSFEFAARRLDRWHEGIEVYFDDGHLSLRLPAPFAAPSTAALSWTDSTGVTHAVDPARPPVWQFEAQAQSFVDAARDNKPDVQSAEDGVRDLIAIESMWRQIEPKRSGAISHA
ncbi:MAG: Gfo/Idh/MocA family protein [Rhodospirillales bacterium]